MSESTIAGAVRRGDRRAQITTAAAELFRELGYHRVGIDDVAAAVGLTGGALYRHFTNKGELLARTLREGIERMESAVADPTGPDVGARLDSVHDRLAALALEHRGFGILLQRETRHLADADRAEVLGRLAAVTDQLASLVVEARPVLERGDASLLARSLLSGMASPAYHSVAVPRARAEALLRSMAAVVAGTGAVPGPPPAPVAARAASPRRTSRRELLLESAIQLFGSRGYWAVRMEDVGAGAGITGPSIYQHFAGKADLLVTALNRGAQWLELGLSQALSSSTSSADALERVIDSYVRFVLEHPDLMSLLLTEAVYLPDDERHLLRKTQHDYVAEWAALLAEVRPDLTEHEALFLTHCVLAIVNDGARSTTVRAGWDVTDVLGALGREILLRSAP